MKFWVAGSSNAYSATAPSWTLGKLKAISIRIDAIFRRYIDVCQYGREHDYLPAGGVPTLTQLPVVDCTPLFSGAALDETAASRLAALLRVLADPARLRILSLLQAQPSHEACVCHLTDFLGLGQPTVSHHLRVLFDAGLVQRERRGNWVYYQAVPGALEGLRAALGGGASAGEASQSTSAACGDDCQCQ